MLDQSLSTEPLYPVFNYGIFRAKNGSETKHVHFHAENFFHGIDVKVLKLLDHVDNCVKQHGVEEVFL